MNLNTLAVVSDGYLNPGSGITLAIASNGYLILDQVTPPVVTPTPGGGSTWKSRTRLPSRRQDELLKEIENDDAEILEVISAFLHSIGGGTQWDL